MNTKANAHGIYGAIAGIAGRAAAAYRRHRTAQMVADLPEYVRKDIGFYRDEHDLGIH